MESDHAVLLLAAAPSVPNESGLAEKNGAGTVTWPSPAATAFGLGSAVLAEALVDRALRRPR